MSLSTKLQELRKKPQHIRERYLLVAMAVIAPVLFTVWYATFKFEGPRGKTFVQGIVGGVQDAFDNPAYDETFKQATFEDVSGQPPAVEE
jgi:hypothetical protein